MNTQALTGATAAVSVPAAVAQAAPPVALPGAGATLENLPRPNADATAAARAQAREAFLSAAKDLREAIGSFDLTYAQFRVNPHNRQVSVAIVDQTSGQVVQQIPNEALTRFAESWDAYVGQLLDHEA